jgi:hypothetical protein
MAAAALLEAKGMAAWQAAWQSTINLGPALQAAW